MEKSQMKKTLKDKTVVPVWECGVFNGKVVLKNKEQFDKHLIPYEGKDNMQLVLKRKVKSRSRQEEKFYHAVVVRMVAQEMDITDQEAHDFLKKLLLRTEERSELSNGKVARYERTMSTTELGDKAYREFWQSCIKWASLPTDDDGLSINSGLSLYIPDPNEADWDSRDEYIKG